MRRVLVTLVACALSGIAAKAHHSISAVYDPERRTKVEGVLAEFHFVNPHPLVLIDVTDGNGGAERWRLEMDNLRELVQVGFSRETLRPGDRVVVVGSPARTQAHSLYIRRLDRPSDGFWYEQIGASPRIGSTRSAPPPPDQPRSLTPNAR